MSDIQCGVIWYELVTPDPTAAARYYAEVMRWRIQGAPATDGAYRLIEAPDGAIGGLRAPHAGEARASPAQGWRFTLNVSDVDETLAAVVAAGGGVVDPALDIPDIGRSAGVCDPQGALFTVMVPTGDAPATAHMPGIPGHGAWHELHAADGAAAFDFYARQFGWDADDVFDMGPEIGLYRHFRIHEIQAGGVLTDPLAAPPYWAIYFQTADIDAAARRIVRAGGGVASGPHEVPGGGFVLTATDPQGGTFHVTGPRIAGRPAPPGQWPV